LAADSVGRPTAIRSAKAMFKRADVDKNKYLDLSEIQRLGIPVSPKDFEAMDVDHNGMVVEVEWTTFMQLRETIGNSKVTIGLTAGGNDLVQAFDVNKDGRLSRAELVLALKTIQTWDVNRDERISEDEIPQRFTATIRIGQPSRRRAAAYPPGPKVATPKPGLPTWFQHMDRNQDGQVSFREFLGPLSLFRKLDANHDGFLDRDEVIEAE
jgi:Ca2+-binding EF-hand superfamily protein